MVRVAQRPLGSRCMVQLGAWGKGDGESKGPPEAEAASIGWVEPLDRGAEIFGGNRQEMGGGESC